MSKYLIKRNDVYHFRIGIPIDVRPFFGDRVEYHASLKTSNKKEADLRKLKFLKLIKERIKSIREDNLENKVYYQSDDFYDNVSEQIENINNQRKRTYQAIAILDDNELYLYFNKTLINSQCKDILDAIDVFIAEVDDSLMNEYAH